MEGEKFPTFDGNATRTQSLRNLTSSYAYAIIEHLWIYVFMCSVWFNDFVPIKSTYKGNWFI